MEPDDIIEEANENKDAVMRSTDNRIVEVLTEFDFVKVAYVMHILNWSWHDTKGVPTVREIKRAAVNLLREVALKDLGTSLATRGFVATRRTDGSLHLEFRVENWDA